MNEVYKPLIVVSPPGPKARAVMEMDHLPKQLRPIVQVVPDWFEPKRLGLVFETSVGKGKLIVCSIDLMKDLETRPVARQLRYSLSKYMQSNAFAPKTELDAELLNKLLPE